MFLYQLQSTTWYTTWYFGWFSNFCFFCTELLQRLMEHLWFRHGGGKYRRCSNGRICSKYSFIYPVFYSEVILIGAFWVSHTSKLRSDWNSNLNLLYLPTMSVFLPIEARRIETVSTLTLQKLFQHAKKSTLVFLINVLQVYLFLKDLPPNSPLLGTIS